LRGSGPELRQVYFFNSPGPDNTSSVIRAVKRRVRLQDIRKVLVASESGRLALRLRKALPRTPIVCVTYDSETRRKYRKPELMKGQLLQRAIAIVDGVREPLGRELTFRNWWERKTLSLSGQTADLFWMTLINVGGHGLRTAVEIVFMAVEAGVVPVRESRVYCWNWLGSGLCHSHEGIQIRRSRWRRARNENED